MQYRLGAGDILAAWDAGATRRPLDRALAVLWAAGAAEEEHPADLPLAERDRRLLAIRADTFGHMLPARATCPDCGAELEMELDARQLAEVLPQPGNNPELKPLTSRDIAAVAELPPAEVAGALCAQLAREGLDDPVDETLLRRIESGASAAELSTRLTCDECDAQWTETLNVPAHVWADVESAALGLLDEIAELASLFGWSEAQILALSPQRRRAYLACARCR